MPRAKDRTQEVDENTPVLYCVKCRTWKGVTRQVCVSVTNSGKIWTCERCLDGKVDSQEAVVSSDKAPTDTEMALGKLAKPCVKVGTDGKCHHKGRHKRD